MCVQVELTTLSQAVTSVASGDLEPTLLLYLVKAGAGTTMGDLVCLLKAASESHYTPQGYIREMQFVGHALIRVHLSSLQAACSLWRACAGSAEVTRRFQIQPLFDPDQVPLSTEDGEERRSRSSSSPQEGRIDEDWVHVQQEVCAEGAWDDPPEQGVQWERGRGQPEKEGPLLTSSHRGGTEGDKFSLAFEQAVGRNIALPTPPAPRPAPLASAAGKGGERERGRDSTSRETINRIGKSDQGLERGGNVFSALMDDEDDEDTL